MRGVRHSYFRRAEEGEVQHLPEGDLLQLLEGMRQMPSDLLLEACSDIRGVEAGKPLPA